MQIRHIRYNPSQRAYEASVRFLHVDRLLDMPARVPAPVAMEPARVTALLAQQALREANRTAWSQGLV